MHADRDAPPATTPADVAAWLVSFFLTLPGAPVYAARQDEARFLDPDASPSGFDWPAFTGEVLGRGSRERLFLLTWARCAARLRAIARNLPNPLAGGTAAEFCREFGVHRSAFERVARRSLAILAAEWDRRRAGRGPAAA